ELATPDVRSHSCHAIDPQLRCRVRTGVRKVFALRVLLLVVAVACSKPAEQPPPAAQPAPGKPAYETSYTGYVSKVYECDHQSCVNATKAALQRLGLRVDEETGGLFKRAFVVEGADGTSVALQVVELGKTTSRISIKVGYFLGDRDAAQRIHNEIDGEVAVRRGQPI